MIKVIINGVSGNMGRAVVDICKIDKEVEVVAGIDPIIDCNFNFPVFKMLCECNIQADVIIDFSTANCIDNMLYEAVNKKLPVVLCTTGLNNETIKHINDSACEIAILKSSNMSVGINLFINILKDVTNKLADSGYDIEIIEKHHRRKIDSPSGTAILLANTINKATNKEYKYIYNRHDRNKARVNNEIGISTVRCGTIVGEHEIIFAGDNEVITFKHSAYSRSIFAKGALLGAKYLINKNPGIYTMQDILK